MHIPEFERHLRRGLEVLRGIAAAGIARRRDGPLDPRLLRDVGLQGGVRNPENRLDTWRNSR